MAHLVEQASRAGARRAFLILLRLLRSQLLQAGHHFRHQGEVRIQSGGIVGFRDVLVFFHQLVREFEATQAQVLGQYQEKPLVPAQ